MHLTIDGFRGNSEKLASEELVHRYREGNVAVDLSCPMTSPRAPSQLDASRRRILPDVPTPFLLLDRQSVANACRDFLAHFPNDRIFYSVKTNSDRRLLRYLAELGLGFEVSSEAELRTIAEISPCPEKIVVSHPIKSRSLIQLARQLSVRYLAFDSFAEIEKIADCWNSAPVILRIAVSNEGSEWPLTGKYGVQPDKALHLLQYAKIRGLDPCGITFHVGSQCERQETWHQAIDAVRAVWLAANDAGISLQVLNVGGGIPVVYDRPVPVAQGLLASTIDYIQQRFANLPEVHVEPGRAIVGEAGTLVTSVVGKAKRENEEWLYLDVGVYNGLFDALHGVAYPITANGRTLTQRYNLGGPTCDSIDVIARDVQLPLVEIGDRLLVHSAGAYTVSCATEFNGFLPPQVVLM